MSIETEPGPEFLKEKYKGISTSPEVESAAEATARKTGVEIRLDDANKRIQNYLDRFKTILNPPALEGHQNFDRRERNLAMLKQSLYDQFIIKPDEIPEGYFQNIIERHREEGRPIEDIPPEIRAELAQTAIDDQKASLDTWVDYLASDDAKYPDYIKYWAFRSLLVTGRYDKEKKKFFERSKSGKSVSPFPELNREALGFVSDAMEKKQTKQPITFPYDIQSEEREEFQKFLERGNFSALYAWAIEKINPITDDLMKVTEGEWRRFPRGSDYRQLSDSLSNYGTGWCIRGESTAQKYLEENDLEVFYSLDENREAKVPRVVIVTQDDGRISEVRGVAEQENLDPYIGEVVDRRLSKLPDGKAYEKRASDMKRLTAIDKKVKASENLTKEELIFLYEINSPIEGFGYQKDPRIEEIRSQRDLKIDAAIVLDYQLEEIAWGQDQINQNTKAYIGPLFSGIFTQLQYLEYIAASFPEGITQRQNCEIGGKSKEELEQEMRDKNINLSDYSKYIIHSPEFTTLPSPEQIQTVRLRVRDLGFPNGATTSEIYARAAELGLELCPAELGPHMRLKDTEQKLSDWYIIAMKPIADRHGRPSVFSLGRNNDGLWLYYDWARPDDGWSPDDGLVFCLPTSARLDESKQAVETDQDSRAT